MTTPEPTPDTATLRALIEAADLPNPVVMTKALDHNGLVATLSEGTGVEARIYVEETADLIEAALNALPGLLDALASAEQQTAELSARPTSEAYDAACAALHEHRDRADTLARVLGRIVETIPELDGLPDEMVGKGLEGIHKVASEHVEADAAAREAKPAAYTTPLDAARAQVAALTRQRDQARGEWRREMAQQLNAEATRRSNLGGDPGITRGYRYAALHVLHADDVAVPVPAGDNQLRVIVVLDRVRGLVYSITTDDAVAQQHVRELAAKHGGDPDAATMTVGLVDPHPSVPAGDTSHDEATPATPDRYMMATQAHHKLGDISRDEPDLAIIYGETDTHYIGQWAAGVGFVNVRFPKATTRDLTGKEIAHYRTQVLELGGAVRPIVIPDPDALAPVAAHAGQDETRGAM